jgi:Tol biopolymer transport system component
MVGDSIIMKTSNGGENWGIQYYLLYPPNYYSIYMLNSNTGWVVGSDGYILKTTDGGGPILVGYMNGNNSFEYNFSLSQNYPNPFNPSTAIKFDLPKSSQVQILVYDILGREVQQLLNEEKIPGSYEVTWDGSNFASGIYFYKIIISQAGSSTDDYVETKKMVLLK